jgi:hypothetical protein
VAEKSNAINRAPDNRHSEKNKKNNENEAALGKATHPLLWRRRFNPAVAHDFFS